MAKKRYISVNGSHYTIVAGRKTVKFDSFDKSYETDDAEVQSVIEGTSYFKEGKIALSETFEDEDADDKKKSSIQLKEYAEVTDYQSAAEILNKDYKVAKGKLTTPEAIMAMAESKHVSFPNLPNLLRSEE